MTALNRYLHQAAGAVGRRQPADPADRLSGGDQPADPAVSEAVEHGDHRHHRLSRRVARTLIQGFITTPIEQAVASAEGIDYITSTSVQGTSTIQIYIKLNFDPNQALTEVLAKVNSVKYLIPRESNDPIVTKSTGQTTAVMYLGFSSEELSGSAISDYLTRVVQPMLSTVDGVASADILGGQTFAMRLWLDPVQMAGRGVSADDVAAAIPPTTSRPRPVRPRAISSSPTSRPIPTCAMSTSSSA